MPPPAPKPGLTDLVGAEYDSAVRLVRQTILSGGSSQQAADLLDRIYPNVSTDYLYLAVERGAQQVASYGEFMRGESNALLEQVADVMPGQTARYSYHVRVRVPNALGVYVDAHDRIDSDTPLTAAQLGQLAANRYYASEMLSSGLAPPPDIAPGAVPPPIEVELVYYTTDLPYG